MTREKNISFHYCALLQKYLLTAVHQHLAEIPPQGQVGELQVDWKWTIPLWGKWRGGQCLENQKYPQVCSRLYFLFIQYIEAVVSESEESTNENTTWIKLWNITLWQCLPESWDIFSLPVVAVEQFRQQLPSSHTTYVFYCAEESRNCILSI